MTALLELRGVTKRFGAVCALEDVSLLINAGTVVSVVGDNGAGKSTLVRTISGIFAPTTGSMTLSGQTIRFDSPLHARSLGIETVHQGLGLVEQFTIAENFFLGRELSRLGPLRLVRDRAMRAEAHRAVTELGVAIPGGVTRKVESMSGGQRQAVAIARGAYWHTRVLVLDEPTAALGVRESDKVVTLVDRLAHERGAAVLMVSHNMDHVRRLSDTVVVLRQGRVVATLARPVDIDEVVGYITGARIAESTAPEQSSGTTP